MRTSIAASSLGTIGRKGGETELGPVNSGDGEASEGEACGGDLRRERRAATSTAVHRGRASQIVQTLKTTGVVLPGNLVGEVGDLRGRHILD